jgi:hypothetical protein
VSAPVLFHDGIGWIAHNGGPCPIHPDSTVRFQYCGGTISHNEQRAGGFIWRWRRPKWFHDIAAYMITGEPGE